MYGAEEEDGGRAAAAAENIHPHPRRGAEAATRPQDDVKMGVVFGLLWLFTGFLQGVHGQGVYGKDVISIQFKYFELTHARAPHMLSECDFECTRAALISEYHKQQLDLVRDLARVRVRVCACVAGSWFIQSCHTRAWPKGTTGRRLHKHRYTHLSIQGQPQC